MNIEAGAWTYEWIENWARIPASEGFAHHGMAVAADGTIFCGDVTAPRIHVLQPDGTLLRSFDVPVAEVHGLCFGSGKDQDLLWITDTGNKGDPKRSGPSSVLKCTPTGEVRQRITVADLGYAPGERCSLTACAQDPATGCLWITDGYGSQRVHCVDPDGRRMFSFDGSTTTAGPHKTPHWIWIDQRKGHSEIYLADRSNDRILVYAPDGTLRRCLDTGFRLPSGFAAFGDTLVVAELAAGIVLLDAEDQIIARIGVHREALDRPGWPNQLDPEGHSIDPRPHLQPGAFNSPHGIAADPGGNIYVSEWLYGGRYICLRRQ